MVVSSSKHIKKLDLGSLRATKRRPKSTTTRRYIERAGKKRYVGTRALKLSQILSWNQQWFADVIYVFLVWTFGNNENNNITL